MIGWITVEEASMLGHQRTAHLRVSRITGIRDWAGWRHVMLEGGDVVKTGEPVWELQQRIDRALGVQRESSIPPIPDRP